MAVDVVSAVGSHCVIFNSVCDWRKSKGLGKRDKGQRVREGAEWPSFAEHRHSPCIHSSVKPTYTICSCRLVDILVYVHSSERTHAKSIIGDKDKGGAGQCRKL